MAGMGTIDQEAQGIAAFHQPESEIAEAAIRSLRSAVTDKVLGIVAKLDDAKAGFVIGIEKVDFVLDNGRPLAMQDQTDLALALGLFDVFGLADD